MKEKVTCFLHVKFNKYKIAAKIQLKDELFNVTQVDRVALKIKLFCGMFPF